MNALNILLHFYPDDTPLRRLLILHSTQVRDKAMAILGNPGLKEVELDLQLVNDGALLHDIGIGRCNAPSIFCEGEANYLLHGTIGAEMLRSYGKENGLDMEPYARICERHTGTGLTADDIIRQQLPLEVKDYCPETLEEKLVCLADKFYSKSSPEKEKPLEHVRKSVSKFGADSLARFDDLCTIFKIV
ncbi:MAG: HDIG domain-containing protein [Bacteroidales bacterium]|nr:HDIG domain-containing protein [Bacteroidales bacterium]